MKTLVLSIVFVSSLLTASANPVSTNSTPLLIGKTVEKMTVWPRLSVFPSGVDLWINNNNNYDVDCSGPVHIYLESGRSYSEYFFGRVSSRGHAYKHFFNRNYNDRIRSANHNIWCRRR